MPVDLGRALVEAFLANERMNQVLLDLLDPKIWDADPPCSKRRNISTSFAHIHNVRRMKLLMFAKSEPAPPKLDRARITPAQARAALAGSAKAFVRLIEHSLARANVVALVCAAITHEAHHRGQICHWARELGAPLTPEQQLKLWQ